MFPLTRVVHTTNAMGIFLLVSSCIHVPRIEDVAESFYTKTTQLSNKDPPQYRGET